MKLSPFHILILTAFFTMFLSGAPSPIFSLYQSEWNLSPIAVGFTYAIYSFGVIVVLLSFGNISDRFGRKKILLFIFSLLCFSDVLFIMANSFLLLLLGRFVLGISVGIITGVLGGALVELHKKHDVTISAMASTASIALGLSLGALFTAIMATVFPYPLHLSYILILVFLLICLVLIIFFIPETGVNIQKITLKKIINIQLPKVPKNILGKFTLGSISTFNAWCAGGLYLGLGSAIVKSLLHSSSLLISAICILFVQGLGSLTFILWSVLKVTYSNKVKIYLGTVALLLGLTISIISLRFTNTFGFIIGAIAIGVGYGLCFMGGSELVQYISPENKRAEIMSAHFLLAYLGLSLPTLLADALSLKMGLNFTFNLISISLFVICFATLFLNKKIVRNI